MTSQRNVRNYKSGPTELRGIIQSVASVRILGY